MSLDKIQYSIMEMRNNYIHRKALKLISVNNLTEEEYIIPELYEQSRIDLLFIPFKCRVPDYFRNPIIRKKYDLLYLDKQRSKAKFLE